MATNNAVGQLSGRPSLSCPGRRSDFPVAGDEHRRPSSKIKHVFFVVRENKNFDALFGDIAGVEGDPSLTLKTRLRGHGEDLAQLPHAGADVHHRRQLLHGRGAIDAGPRVDDPRAHHRFQRAHLGRPRAVDTTRDRFPAAACSPWAGRWRARSSTGSLHRTTWSSTCSARSSARPRRYPPHNPIDAKYPGGPFQNIGYNDLEKACYWPVAPASLCDINQIRLHHVAQRSHLRRVAAATRRPRPSAPINDEATGMFVDAVSHSPLWESSLIVITEDDPLDGGEHIDQPSHAARDDFAVDQARLRVQDPLRHAPASTGSSPTSSASPIPTRSRPRPGCLSMRSPPRPTTRRTPTRRTPIRSRAAAAPRRRRRCSPRAGTSASPTNSRGSSSQVVRWMRGKQLERLTPEHERRVRAPHLRAGAGAGRRGARAASSRSTVLAGGRR